jgi:hypothetical protein
MGHSDATGRTKVVLFEHVASARPILEDIKVLITACSVLLKDIPSRVLEEETIATIILSCILREHTLMNAMEEKPAVVVVSGRVPLERPIRETIKDEAIEAVARSRVLRESDTQPTKAGLKADPAVAHGRIPPERPRGTIEGEAGAVARGRVLCESTAAALKKAEITTHGRVPPEGGPTSPKQGKAQRLAVLDRDSRPTLQNPREESNEYTACDGMVVAVQRDVIGPNVDVASMVLGQRRVCRDHERACGPPDGERQIA